MSQKQEDKIIPISKEKTYGLGLDPDKLCVVVYKRKLYQEDTQVPMKFNKTIDYKFYAKGDFGPWQLAPKPYRVSLDNALVWIHDMMVTDKLDGVSDIWAVANIVKNERQSFIEQLVEISSPIKTALLAQLSVDSSIESTSCGTTTLSPSPTPKKTSKKKS